MSVSLSRPGPEPPKPISPSAPSASQVGSSASVRIPRQRATRSSHLLAPVVEDPLRHQPGVRVVPDVEVQVGQRLGVLGHRAADREAVGEGHDGIVGTAVRRGRKVRRRASGPGTKSTAVMPSAAQGQDGQAVREEGPHLPRPRRGERHSRLAIGGTSAPRRAIADRRRTASGRGTPRTASRPAYHSAYGGMAISMSSASSATTASTSDALPGRDEGRHGLADPPVAHLPEHRAAGSAREGGRARRPGPAAARSSPTATVVSRLSAVSAAENASTSRNTSTARCRGGRCWSAATNASSTASRCS